MTEDILRAYRILEIKPGASRSEIKRAYLDLVKVWHPDRFGHDPAMERRAQEKLKEVNAAYERLRASTGSRSSAERDRRATSKEVHSVQVDRFVYYEVFCDEIVASSQLRNSEWGKTRLTDAWVNKLAEFAKTFRAVDYVLNEAVEFDGRVISHTDLIQRKIFLNRSAALNLKTALIPLGVICIRDKLNGIPPKHKELIRKALGHAGWRGGQLFESENYLNAEVALSNGAAEYFLDRTLNKRSEWSSWWQDVGSYWRMNSLDDSSVWLGYCIMNEPIGGYSWKFG